MYSFFIIRNFDVLLRQFAELHILKRKLFAQVIASAWYTVNYFKVSFGKQDLINEVVKQILETEQLTIDIKKSNLITILNIPKTKLQINACI